MDKQEFEKQKERISNYTKLANKEKFLKDYIDKVGIGILNIVTGYQYKLDFNELDLEIKSEIEKLIINCLENEINKIHKNQEML